MKLSTSVSVLTLTLLCDLVHAKNQEIFRVFLECVDKNKFNPYASPLLTSDGHEKCDVFNEDLKNTCSQTTASVCSYEPLGSFVLAQSWYASPGLGPADEFTLTSMVSSDSAGSLNYQHKHSSTISSAKEILTKVE